MFVAAHENLRDANLLAFLYLIGEIHARTLAGLGGNVIHQGMKLGVGNTLVVVKREHVVAVAGDVEIRIGLPRGGSDRAGKLLAVDGVVALDHEVGNARLRTFRDAESDKEVARVASIVVHQIAAHLHVPEAVGLIQFGERRHVTGQLPGTEAPGEPNAAG